MAQEWDPFVEILKLQTRLNERIGLAFKGFRKPHSHVSHSAKKVEIEVKLPNTSKKDVKLKINPKAVIIQAERKTRKSKKTKSDYTKSEEYSGFFRKIYLSPGLDVKNAKAKFSNGNLKILIPKKNK